jgi:hypothetical protein
MALLTLVCIEVDQWVVIEDEGFMSQIRGIAVRPGSSRSGCVVFGPSRFKEAELFIANRNRMEVQ